MKTRWTKSVATPFHSHQGEECMTKDSPMANLVSMAYAKWLVANRRRQFELASLMYAMLPAEEKDKFIDGLKDWWRLWRANEKRAEQHLAEHRRRSLKFQ
jgi:hypothetical protein